ncbi:MAG: tetraacyldisaccharide 4'-kinase [Crocinitomicaceae bacterium]|nr:tetraacyldisaccharide 4'-kinase [Crocinitomicaceae bacterium]MBK8925703.1 tetraacyldisaccharide 4'-kinase [Crocinitomicaceae bacterium]
MQFLKLLLFPFAFLYWAITGLRNLFYKYGIFKSSKFNLPIISVGNLSLGGTGKTPHTEYLIRLLKDKYQLATLSRGFGRKEYQFRIADDKATVNNLGDEPLQYHMKFGSSITVAVEANRVHGVMDICREKPSTNLILLDDAFQHRAIQPGLSILLTTLEKPFYQDWIVPVGNLRESRSGFKRADIIVFTKCKSLDLSNKENIISKLKPCSHQHVFFSTVTYGSMSSLTDDSMLFGLSGYQLIVVTGIADGAPLVEHLRENNEILYHCRYRDHHSFNTRDINEIHDLFDKFAGPQTLIVTTEKDAMRLKTPILTETLSDYPWYYQNIEVELDKPEEFKKLILDYAEKNS